MVLFFGQLEDGLRARIATDMYERRVSAGEILIQEGDTGLTAAELYIVKDGEFEVGSTSSSPSASVCGPAQRPWANRASLVPVGPLIRFGYMHTGLRSPFARISNRFRPAAGAGAAADRQLQGQYEAARRYVRRGRPHVQRSALGHGRGNEGLHRLGPRAGHLQVRPKPVSCSQCGT